MAKNGQFSDLNSSYGTLLFTEFTEFTEFIEQYKTQYENCLPKAKLFELTLPWLAAREESFDIDLNERPKQAKIKQIFIVNLWVRQTQTQAKTYLRSYYIKRFFSKSFWQKLLTGKVKTKSALTDIQNFHQQSRTSIDINKKENFVTQMLRGLNQFSGTCDIFLSGNDLTADEFKLLIKSNKHWRQTMARATINKQTIDHADHTFSQRDKQSQLIKLISEAIVK